MPCPSRSQVGLYLQLGVLWAGDRLLGVHDLPAGIWFFTNCNSIRETGVGKEATAAGRPRLYSCTIHLWSTSRPTCPSALRP